MFVPHTFVRHVERWYFRMLDGGSSPDYRNAPVKFSSLLYATPWTYFTTLRLGVPLVGGSFTGLALYTHWNSERNQP